MKNISLNKLIKFVFFPSLLLSIFLSSSDFLFRLSQNGLIGEQLGFAQIPSLKVPTILPQIILTLFLLIFSVSKPFEKIFKWTLVMLVCVISLLTILLHFNENLELQGVPDTLGIYKPLLVHWPISLMYIVLSIAHFKLFELFIWGFMNRLTSGSDGIKCYIPLAFILGLAGPFISSLGLTAMGVSKWPLMGMIIPAIALMIGSLFIFNWAWKRLPQNLLQPQDDPSVLRMRFPFLSAAYLLAGGVMIKSFLNMLFKYQLKMQFPDAASYVKFMGRYSVSLGSTTIAISVIWALLGSWLILKKGWKTTVFYGSLSILGGGIIFLGLSTSWLNQGIYSGFLTGTTFTLLFPLVQILYLYLPYRNRFKTKIVTEMIALPLMKEIPPLITQRLLMVFGSITAITLYIKILISILMVLLIIASYTASSRFSVTKKKS